MALKLNLPENKALVLTVDYRKILIKLKTEDLICTGIAENNEDVELITLDTLECYLQELTCAIVCTPNYEKGGTKVVFGGPKEIIVSKEKNQNLPYFKNQSSSSGL